MGITCSLGIAAVGYMDLGGVSRPLLLRSEDKCGGLWRSPCFCHSLGAEEKQPWTVGEQRGEGVAMF